jgi:hypothetical protein
LADLTNEAQYSHREYNQHEYKSYKNESTISETEKLQNELASIQEK